MNENLVYEYGLIVHEKIFGVREHDLRPRKIIWCTNRVYLMIVPLTQEWESYFVKSVHRNETRKAASQNRNSNLEKFV